jgi:hypothetical protein
MYKITKKFILLLTILTLNAPTSSRAQPPIDYENVEDNPAPFDSAYGVGILVAGAICYGLKKAHQKKQADAS